MRFVVCFCLDNWIIFNLYSAEVFSGYIHREVLPGCKPHPGDIVEAGPLAVSDHLHIYPDHTYYSVKKNGIKLNYTNLRHLQ